MGRWNKKSPSKLLHTVKRGIVSLFVCVVVMLPLIFIGLQIGNMTGLFSRDPRKATPLAELQTRTIDKSGAAVKPFEEPYITVTFDDGWASIYSNAGPLLQQYGIPTTQYVLSGTEQDKGYMSFAQIIQLQKAGHEIGCHSVDHPDLTTLDQTDLKAQLQGCKDTLEKKLGTPISDFASPYGSENKTSVIGIKSIFRSERNTAGDITTNAADDNDINTAGKFNKYGIIAITIRKSTTIAQLQSAIDYAKAHNGWLVLNYHEVEADAGEYSVTPAALKEQLNVINKAPMRVVTMGQFLDQYDKQAAKQPTRENN